MRIILMIGPPFSGKGTQCKLISEKLAIKHISTGEIIRKEIERKTTFGLEAVKFEREGILLPDTLIEELLKKIIESNLAQRGIIIDGFPRTINQVDFFLPFLERNNLKIDLMIILYVSNKELKIRGEKRINEANRKDDVAEIQTRRLDFYNTITIPAIEHLKTKVPFYELLAEGPIADVNEKILKMLIYE